MEDKDLKVLLCCACKMENKYIEEWISFYKDNVGVDKIVLFDNNDIDGEKLVDVPLVKELSKEGFIDIYYQQGKRGMQTAQFTECYNMYYKEYDWFMFFDVDEFLMFKEAKNVKEYLSQEKFDPFDMIHVQWKLYDDNNLVYVENNDYSLVKRFTHPLDIKNLLKTQLDDNLEGYCYHKTILRGRQHRSIRFFSGNSHVPCESYSDPNLKASDANGKETNPYRAADKYLPDAEACLNHYICKTAEEYWTNKMVRLCGSLTLECDEKERVNLKLFFKYNKITIEKLNYFNEVCPDLCREYLEYITTICARFSRFGNLNLSPKFERPKGKMVHDKKTGETIFLS